MESLFPNGAVSPSGIWKGYIKPMKMFNINLWSCKFLLASNEWQVTPSQLIRSRKRPLLTKQNFSLRSSRDLFLMAVLSSISQIVSVTVRPQHLSLCLSQWEAGPRVLYPLAGKSVVITSTSGHFYGPLNQSADHYFICIVKYHTLSLLLFISEVLTQF